MTTLLTAWLIGCACGAVFLLTVPIAGPYLLYPAYCRLRQWWKQNRPHWSDTKRRILKRLSGEHIRYVVGLIGTYLLFIAVLVLCWVSLVITARP
jgi:hypothetical protein